MNLLNEKLNKLILSKKNQLDHLRPLPESAVRKLKEQFQIEMTYNSNAIEGNRLTLKETFLVINEGITIKGKSLKDHLEAKDHKEALEYLYDIVEHQKRHSFSEKTLRELHQIVTHEIDKEWAGQYRNSPVIITGAEHKPPDALHIKEEINNLFNWFNENVKKIPVIKLAALFHHKLVYIHPFFDGNGRVARLMMNLILMRDGYPLVIILKNDRKKYYQVLARADKGKMASLVQFIAQTVLRSLELYLKTLRPSDKNQKKYLSLSQIAVQSAYSAKYLNLLVRSGKLEAHKEGRIWITTKEALRDYINNRERKRE